MALLLKSSVRNLEFDSAAFEDLAWWVEHDRQKALCCINPASTRRKRGVLPREVSQMPWDSTCGRNWLGSERWALTAWEKSAEGRGGAPWTPRRPERSYRLVTDRWQESLARPGVGALWGLGERSANVWAGASRRKRPHRRIRDPKVRWCGRDEVVRSPPIPIRCL
jgi:hypothetical protein